MNIARARHYIQKIARLGVKNSFIVVRHRAQAACTTVYWRQRCSTNKASHTWACIAKKYRKNTDFAPWWHQQLLPLSYADHLFGDQTPQAIITQADLFVQKTFDVLGSGALTFEHMPWHIDVRLQQQNRTADCSFDATLFYKDIVIETGTSEQLGKDIKVPWELARFHQAPVLGKAYALTGDENYARAFGEQVTDWLDHNPYLRGIHWLCAMEVGLRMTNWIVAAHYFKKSSVLDDSFWQRFVCSLYDHLIYLENNFELYDTRTSNHYLADLVGYLYGCYFFKNLGISKKTVWCYNELLAEMERQIFDEGTSYEGSSSYHRLVTELFYHADLLLQEMAVDRPLIWKQKLSRMFLFLRWSEYLQIGDSDSGKVLYYGVTPSMMWHTEGAVSGQKEYPGFGLSFVKTDHWQVSLRHHAYTHRQPSGHFHNDVGSITLSLDHIPLIVDPGSYVYTPSINWRNRFRSAAVHNSFFVQNEEPVLLDASPFVFAIPEHDGITTSNQLKPYQLKTAHQLYKRFGLEAHRIVAINEQEITITDWWQSLDQKIKQVPTCWNFTVSPTITVHQAGNDTLFVYNAKPLAQLCSSVPFTIEQGWYSPEYGVKVACKQLKAVRLISSRQLVTTKFVFL